MTYRFLKVCSLKLSLSLHWHSVTYMYNKLTEYSDGPENR